MNAILLAALSVGGFVILAVIGIAVARRFIHHHVSEGHNDVLVPMFLTAGVIYAVLIGFLVVGQWERYSEANANAAEEASLLVPLYRLSLIMAPDKGEVMREALRSYSHDVINGWSAFSHGGRVSAPGHDFATIINTFSTLTPTSAARQITDAKFLDIFTQVSNDRNKRYLQRSESLSWIMWVVAIGGGIVIVAMSFLLYMESQILHMVMAAVMAGLIGTLLFATALLDHPFAGPLAIDPAPFQASLAVFKGVDRGN